MSLTLMQIIATAKIGRQHRATQMNAETYTFFIRHYRLLTAPGHSIALACKKAATNGYAT